MRIRWLCVLGCLQVGAAWAEGAAHCTHIVDRETRLDCYDRHYRVETVANAPSFVRTAQSDAAAVNAPPLVVTEELVPSPIQRRVVFERASEANRFSITPHRPNYFIPGSFNRTADFDVYGDIGDSFRETEVKFQLSLKTLLAKDLWRGSAINLAYTQLSYWQLYADEDASAPFRETNHEPEAIWEIPLGLQLLGWHARVANLSVVHQSNGRSRTLSRSWNRVAGEIVFEKGRFVVVAKAWKRFEFSDVDDNPRIEEFMGRGQIGLAYANRDHTFTLLHKNAFGAERRGGTELTWTFPLVNKIRGFVQVYSGYGENLIDMEEYTNRFGMGISLSDWL